MESLKNKKLSIELEQSRRESPVLGMRGPPVKISPSQRHFPPQTQGNNGRKGVRRDGSVMSKLSMESREQSR